MGRAEKDRACTASPPTPLRRERGVDSEIPLIKPPPLPPLLQRGGVLETVRLSNNERKYLRTTRGITDITPLPLEATLYTHLLGSYKRQLDVQKSVVLSLL